MLRELEALVSGLFRSKKTRAEDAKLIEALEMEDEVDEPTAYAVLLTDLARADGNLNQPERSVIKKALTELFPDSSADIDTIIQESINLLDSFRGPGSFVARVKEQYTPEERQRLYALLDKVIDADGAEDLDEQYLRDKFRELLK